MGILFLKLQKTVEGPIETGPSTVYRERLVVFSLLTAKPYSLPSIQPAHQLAQAAPAGACAGCPHT